MTLLKREYIGKRFHRLVILNDAEPQISPGGRVQKRVLCECDCGKRKTINLASIKRESTRSCGCLHKEARGSHGGCHTKSYSCWADIKTRCFNKKHRGYGYYGARGIKICERWMKFENFFEDMGECPDGKSIDRKDNNGNYCKENCRWADRTQQNNNTRRNHFLEFRGKRLTIAQWSRITNIKYHIIYKRIGKGWSVERTLTEPVNYAV